MYVTLVTINKSLRCTVTIDSSVLIICDHTFTHIHFMMTPSCSHHLLEKEEKCEFCGFYGYCAFSSGFDIILCHFGSLRPISWSSVSMDCAYIWLCHQGNFTNFQQNGEFCYILDGQWWNFEKVTNFHCNLNELWWNFGKSKFVLKLKWTNLVDPALKYQLCGCVLLWILFMNGAQLCQISLWLHLVIKTCAFYWSKLRILSDGLVIFTAEWSH